MPDGDRLHSELGLRYQLPYRRLCEGVMRPDEQARGIAERIKREVTAELAPALCAVTDRLNSLSEIIGQQGSASIDWQEEIFALRETALSPVVAWGGTSPSGTARGISKRNYEIVMRAAQDMLNGMEDGSTPANIPSAFCRRFMRRLYDAQFGDATPVLEKHFNDVSPASLRERLKCIQPYLDSELNYLADQLAVNKADETLRLRLRARKREKIQDLDSDVMDVFH